MIFLYSAKRGKCVEREVDPALCGPLCVQKVLEQFDLNESAYLIWRKLLEISVHDNQSEGFSTLQLNQVIKGYGLSSVVIAVSNALPTWETEYIAHIRPEKAGDLGHFVVVKCKGDGLAVWNPSSSGYDVDLSAIDACILVGRSHVEIDKNGYVAVGSKSLFPPILVLAIFAGMWLLKKGFNSVWLILRKGIENE